MWPVGDDEVFAKLPYDRPPTVDAIRERIRAALSRPDGRGYRSVHGASHR
ncbi:hypothetical protein [Streptomyces sp. 147326]